MDLPNIANEEDASTLNLGPDFINAMCLMNSEVAFLLEKSQQTRDNEENLSESSQVFTKTLAYVNRFSKLKSYGIIKEIRNLLKKKNLKDFEIVSLVNLCPETTEEAVSLIPTLKKLAEEDLKEILEDLHHYSSTATSTSITTNII
jgi:DNA-directed RNA polymerase II subunit RPB4